MLTETLEYAIHKWPEWLQSIEKSRNTLNYDPLSPLKERTIWYESNRAEAITEACIQALASLLLPKTFGRYWIACLLSDFRRGSRVDFEKIRWPANWLDSEAHPLEPLESKQSNYSPFSFPSEPVPPGCMRIEVDARRYYRGDERLKDDLSVADSVRILPPSLVSVTIPKWGRPEFLSTLKIAIVPRDQWPRAWRNKDALPLLADFPKDATCVPRMTHHRSAEVNLTIGKAQATIEVPPWAVSDELLDLAHKQLFAIRQWHARMDIHPMDRLLRRAAATVSDRNDKVPQAWPRWLEEFQGGTITYQDLVERAYYWMTNGRLPRFPGTQPTDAKRAADWTRKWLQRNGLSAGTLRRYWWRNVKFKGS